MAQFLRELLDTAAARVTRSTAIQPWHWTIAILVALIVAALLAGNAPAWLLVWAAVLITLAFLGGSAAYFYLMVHSPDSLRSEKFTLDKMRIEHGLVGDSAKGLRETGGGVSESLLVEAKLIGSRDKPE